MNSYLKINELKDGYVYKIQARNASYGVWIESKKGFVISRWKFTRNYLFVEYHWDFDDIIGTVKPIEILEKFPFEFKKYSLEHNSWEDRTNKEVLTYLDNFDDTRDESIKRLSYGELLQRRLYRQQITLYKRNSIGIFWIYEKQVFSEVQKLEDIKSINGFKDSNLSHYKIWDKIKNQHPKFYLYEYEDIPSGRIVYDIENNIFIIYCNENILQDEVSKRLILEKFTLVKRFERSQDRIQFKEDEHYKII